MTMRSTLGRVCVLLGCLSGCGEAESEVLMPEFSKSSIAVRTAPIHHCPVDDPDCDGVYGANDRCPEVPGGDMPEYGCHKPPAQGADCYANFIGGWNNYKLSFPWQICTSQPKRTGEAFNASTWGTSLRGDITFDMQPGKLYPIYAWHAEAGGSAYSIAVTVQDGPKLRTIISQPVVARSDKYGAERPRDRIALGNTVRLVGPDVPGQTIYVLATTINPETLVPDPQILTCTTGKSCQFIGY